MLTRVIVSGSLSKQLGWNGGSGFFSLIWVDSGTVDSGSHGEAGMGRQAQAEEEVGTLGGN